MQLFKQFRERRIVQILLSYAAAGWVALEAVSQFVERGVLPDLFYLVLLVWVIGGGAATAVLGWYHGEKGHQSVTRLEIVLLVLVGLFTVAGTANTISRVRAGQAVASAIDAASGLDPRRLAVLYFDDRSAAGDLGFLADGLTEELIAGLTGVGGIDVVSSNGTAQYRGSGLAGDSIATLLGAGTFARGEIDQRGDEVEVDIALVDAESGATIERGAFTGPMAEASALQAQLAGQMSRLLRTWLGEEVRLRERRLGQVNDAAWILVQRGARAREEADALFMDDDVTGANGLWDRADSLYASAAEQAPQWAEPVVRRARLVYDRSRYESDVQDADDMMREADGFVAAALKLEPRNADALEIRGTISYLRWLLSLEPDHDAAERLLESAEQDLRTATDIEPLQANAWNVLGHLYYQRDDIVEANLAARRAYEADAYLRAAPDILWRLWSTSYDLENRPQSRQWCEEGRRRFPDNSRFYQCQIWNMTLGSEEPDVQRAWALADTAVSLTPGPARPMTTLEMRVLVAGAMARASVDRDAPPAQRDMLADSARAVLDGTQANSEMDPAGDLLMTKAFVLALLGDHQGAVGLLQRFLTFNPERREGFAQHNHWWWRDLRSDPAFQRMIGT